MTEDKSGGHETRLPDHVTEEMERVAKQYRKWTYDVLRGALEKEQLVEVAGPAPATGVLNGTLAFAVSMWAGSGADLEDMQRILAMIWGQMARRQGTQSGPVTGPN